MQTELQVMIRKLALKYHRSPTEIEKILEAPYKMAAEVIANSDKEKCAFFNIRIPSIGIFIARSAILKRMHGDNNIEINNDEEELKRLKKQVLQKERKKRNV